MILSDMHIEQSNLIENVRGIKELTQSKLAWQYLSWVEDLTLDVVLNTHELILKNLDPGIAGKIRKVNVMVGGRSCPHFITVPALLNDWLEFMRQPELHDPKKMHIEFEHIHPFRDGNGRIGRMLMWWHEIKCGMEPTLIRYENRGRYYDWF